MLNNKCKGIFLVLLMVGALFLSSCKKAGTEPGNQASRFKIGYSALTLMNPFFKEIADSMRDEAAKNGFDVLVVSGELDPARQADQINDFIVQKVDAIVLNPCDSRSIGPAIKAANSAGIPVFTADIACLDKTAKVVCHVATDNYVGGRQAGKAIIKALNGQGKVAILSHPMVESAMLRAKGFRDEIKESAPSITIVGEWAGLGAKDESFRVFQEVLQSHPDIDGLFAVNDPSALGAISALEIAKKVDKVKVVGFDGQPEAKQAILQGTMYATAIQYPDKIGRIVVQKIVSYLDGEKIDAEELIPTGLFFKEDAEKELKK